MPSLKRFTRRLPRKQRGGSEKLCKALAEIDASVEDIKKLIAEGESVNEKCASGKYPIHYASNQDDIKVLELLLKSGADPNVTDVQGNTPFYLLAKYANTENLKYMHLLANAGADVNKIHSDGMSPLLYSTFHLSPGRNPDFILGLLEMGVDVNQQSANGKTPLLNALDKLSNTNVKVALKLLEKGAKPIGKDELYIACSKNGTLELITKLLDAGANPNGDSPLKMPIDAIAQGNYISNELTKLQLLIDRGAKVSYKALIRYSGFKNVSTELIKLLFSKVELNNEQLNNFLIAVSSTGYVDCVKMAFEAGAKPSEESIKARLEDYSGPDDITLKVIEMHVEAGLRISEIPYILSYFKNEHPKSFKKLIELGANMNYSRQPEGIFPILYTSISNSWLKYVDILLDNNADVNIPDLDNLTPLHMAVMFRNVDLVKKLLEKGADKNIRNKDGKRPIDLAKTKAIRDLLKDPDEPKVPEAKWEGWTRGDAAQLDGIFGDDETARNFALCPVCMKYVVRSDACMYMSHNCKTSKGYYHDKLYEKYRNSEGIINWCTICGRICKGHNHFQLSPASGPKPEIIHGEDPFATDCKYEGGGGVDEKLLRFRRLREYARELQDEVGQIGWWQAMDELCEEMWNAPMARKRGVMTRMKTNKKFNIPNTNFPLTLPPTQNAPNVPFTTGEAPIVHPEETDDFTNATYIDDKNIIQFQHRMSNGSMNRHAGPGQQISREGFKHFVKTMLEDPTAEGFGKCWQFKTKSQMIPLSAEDKALVCDAVLHPEEVKAALNLEDPEEAKLAEGYRKAFNAMFDTRKAVRPYRNEDEEENKWDEHSQIEERNNWNNGNNDRWNDRNEPENWERNRW